VSSEASGRLAVIISGEDWGSPEDLEGRGALGLLGVTGALVYPPDYCEKAVALGSGQIMAAGCADLIVVEGNVATMRLDWGSILEARIRALSRSPEEARSLLDHDKAQRYLDEPAGPTPFFFPEMIEQGTVSCFAGGGGAGKSRIGIALGILAALPNAAGGGNLLGSDCGVCSIMHILYEDGPSQVNRRFNLMTRHLPEEQRRLVASRTHFHEAAGCPKGGFTPEFPEKIIRAIQHWNLNHPDAPIKFVTIDPLFRALSDAPELDQRNMNDGQASDWAYQCCQTIALATRASVQFVTHVSQATQRSKKSDADGSVAFGSVFTGNAARSVSFIKVIPREEYEALRLDHGHLDKIEGKPGKILCQKVVKANDFRDGSRAFYVCYARPSGEALREGDRPSGSIELLGVVTDEEAAACGPPPEAEGSDPGHVTPEEVLAAFEKAEKTVEGLEPGDAIDRKVIESILRHSFGKHARPAERALRNDSPAPGLELVMARKDRREQPGQRVLDADGESIARRRTKGLLRVPAPEPEEPGI
jgi:hypothetical protein